MVFLQLCVYIGIFLWMLSPDPPWVLCAERQGRRVLLLGAAVVCACYLLSMTGQMFLLMVLGTFDIPRFLIFYLYSAIVVLFWLLSAELFHRIQYKMSIRRALLKKKSLAVWFLISVLASLAFALCSMIGGMAMTYAMRTLEPGFMRFLFRCCNFLFRLRFPDVLLLICNSVLYYRTLRYLIHAVERG